MLKFLTSTNLSPNSDIKCGEIFYNNINHITIFCTLCEIKSLQFDDFLKHLGNVHLESKKDFSEDNLEKFDDNVLEYYVEQVVEGSECEAENSFREEENELDDDLLEYDVEQYSEDGDFEAENIFNEYPVNGHCETESIFNEKGNKLEDNILEMNVEQFVEDGNCDAESFLMKEKKKKIAAVIDFDTENTFSEEAKEFIDNVLEDDVEQFVGGNDYETESSLRKEENLKNLRQLKRKHEIKRRKRFKWETEDTNNKIRDESELKDNVLKDEINQFAEDSDLFSESTFIEEENELEHDLEQIIEGNDFQENSSLNEEKNLKILKKSKSKDEIKTRKICKEEEHENNNKENAHDLEIQFKPPSSKAEIPNQTSISRTKKIPKEQEYSCPDCQQTFALRKAMDQHVFEAHNGYKCSQCDKRFRLKHQHQRHELSHKRREEKINRKYPCNMKDCSKIFTDPEVLKRHLEVHNIMACEFVCEVENCRKAFDTKSRLTAHKHTHRKVKNFICDACGFSCRAYGTLSIHQRIHTGEKPYACEICDKRFASTTAVNRHKITHSNIRQYVCEICQAAFNTYGVLQRHRFIHSDKRTFQCKFCDKAFKQVHGLDGHMRRLHMEPKEKKDGNKVEIV